MAGCIFISHSSADANKASELCTLLERQDLTCWIAPRDIPPGTEYAVAIIGGIEQCAAMVVLISRDSNESQYVHKEVERAVANKKTVIPVFLETVPLSKKLELFLSAPQWIKLWELGLPAVASKIVAVVTHRPEPVAPRREPPRKQILRQVFQIGALAAVIVCVCFVGIRLHWGLRQDTAAPGSVEPSLSGETLRMLEESLALVGQGRTNEARRLLTALPASSSAQHLVQAVAAHLQSLDGTAQRSEVRLLIDRLDARAAVRSTATNGTAGACRPRVLACLGPTGLGSPQAEAAATLCRLSLQSELARVGGSHLVDRQALQSILAELDLGSSALADENARQTIGRLLPASLLLLGDLAQLDGQRMLFVRLLDSETSRIAFSTNLAWISGTDPTPLTMLLAKQLAEQAVMARPLSDTFTPTSDQEATMRIGRFHGLTEKSVFTLHPAARATDGTLKSAPVIIGRARIQQLEEMTCMIACTWASPPATNGLLLAREAISAYR